MCFISVDVSGIGIPDTWLNVSGIPIPETRTFLNSFEMHPLLNTGQMDSEWTLPSRMDSNPMAWYIMVDGLILDACSLPHHIQEVAYDKGLIPYIPADRA